MDFATDQKAIIPELKRLVDIVARLRKECPWDKAQTHQSLKPYLMEECYELLEALDQLPSQEGFPTFLVEEMGDLLLQIVLHATIGEEAGTYHLGHVAKALSDKLVRRHPHVFGDHSLTSPEAVKASWETIKKAEKKNNSNKNSCLSGVPAALPALQKAYRIGEKCAGLGFDWPSATDAWSKVEEEMGELSRATSSTEQQEEFGDLLFALVNYGRLRGWNAEDCLRSSLHKFQSRFSLVEPQLKKGQSLQEMDQLWEAAKKQVSRKPL